MHDDFFAWVRLCLFIILILIFALFCSISETKFRMEQPEPTDPIQEEPTYLAQDTTPAIIPTEAEPATEPTFQHTLSPNTPDTKPANTATEPPTEPTSTEIEPPSQTEPITEATTETEPPEEWVSLGTYTLTAYCACLECCGEHALDRPLDENGKPIVYTSIGAVAQAGVTIAVDPGVIPYGSEVKINDHVYIAQDTGGNIKGDRIDIYFDDHQAALRFGLQTYEVFIRA